MHPLRPILLWASQSRWLGERLPRRRFFRRAVRRFLPGEDRTAALAEAARLVDEGLGVVFTLLGEHVTSEGSVHAVMREYAALLEDCPSKAPGAHLSVKLTQLGLDLDADLALRNVEALAGRAQASGSFVWIDMEESPRKDATVRLFRSLLEAGLGDAVGLCLQAYLRSTPADLASLLSLSPTIRLVKGAYAEPRHLAFARRAEVDEAYLRLAQTALRGGGQVALGTHDLKLIHRFRRWRDREGLPSKRTAFHMLYGIRNRELRELAGEGEDTRVLISYGEAWFPWYMRRLAERPANLTFVLRNLVRP